MIRHNKPFEDRLKRWLDNKRTLYQAFSEGQTLHICEQEKGGAADVQFKVPERCSAVQWSLKDSMPFLLEAKTADGAIVLCRDNGSYEAWIIECKKTVDQSKWNEIHKQFRGTLGRLLALAGVLGIEFLKVGFGTAFRDDKLSEDESPNPAQGKWMLGPAEDEEQRNQNRAAREQMAWMRDQVRVDGIEEIFEHRKIRLDGQGRGELGI